jgi:hypothetical protein
MKTFTKTALAASIMFLSGIASANNMYIDVGNNAYDSNGGGHIADADTTTGVFDEFGFSQILATSIYDFSDGSALGSFYDTNISSELSFAGLPAAGASLGGPNVSLIMPLCGSGQCDLDALSPLVPPLSSDNEGFLNTWELLVEYHFDGTLTAGGPVYTGGSFNVLFNSFINNADDRQVLGGTLTGSQLQAANLNLFFDITFAEAGWLFIEDNAGSGTFTDAAEGVARGDAGGSYDKLVLDTNVNPPIPNANQLLLVVDGGLNPNAIRQTTLDGSVTSSIPEPSTIAMLGLGLLGLGARARRRNKN